MHFAQRLFVPFQYISNQNINDQAKNRGSQKLPRFLLD
jgi:hypothetical protein